MSKYIVRLALGTDADTPIEAVQDFINQLNEQGLRSWTYRVDDMTGQVMFVNGYGEESTIEELFEVVKDRSDTLSELARSLIRGD